MVIMYEVIGWPRSCPSERFSEGLYNTRDRAEEEKEKAEKEYSRCDFEIEEKCVYK